MIITVTAVYVYVSWKGLCMLSISHADIGEDEINIHSSDQSTVFKDPRRSPVIVKQTTITSRGDHCFNTGQSLLSLEQPPPRYVPP